MATPFQERVFAVVSRIPRGRVASYKLVATLAGAPGAARQCGRVMRLMGDAPWWRVISQEGKVAIQTPPLRFDQILRLREEGVDVSDAGEVDYDKFCWKPRVTTPTRASARARD